MKKGLLVLVLLVAAGVGAQDKKPAPCIDGETLQKCIDKVASSWEKSMLISQQATGNANTGAGGPLLNSQSATTDFLNLLTAALAVPMDGSGAIPMSIDFNPHDDLKLQVVFARPEMSGAVRERIAGNGAALVTIEDSLSEFDDLTVKAAYGPTNQVFGREITPHHDLYETKLRDHLQNTSVAAGLDMRATQQALEQESLRFAEAFAVLLNNQPQLYGTVSYRARKDVAGPDERSARLTFEKGFNNLNNLATGSNVVENAKNSHDDRLSFSLEYRTSNALSVVLPEYSVDFRATPARTFVYSLAYGRNRMLAEKGRFDVAVDYEDTNASTIIDAVPPADPAALPEAVKDRFVASATYTYQMTGQMAMPLTLTYANHASFLDVDRKLSAHFGISFRMP